MKKIPSFRFHPLMVAAALAWAPAISPVASPASLEAQTTTTRVMVRVTSHDAKIIGTGVGGARVTIRDVRSGAVLAEGVQEGGTGDTSLIMGARERGGAVYDTEGAAGFLAELELSEPTWVEITAEGPLGTPDALRRVTSTTLLVPGRDVLELPEELHRRIQVRRRAHLGQKRHPGLHAYLGPPGIHVHLDRRQLLTRLRALRGDLSSGGSAAGEPGGGGFFLLFLEQAHEAFS